MPFFKKEFTATVYVESESSSVWDLMFGLRVDDEIMPPKEGVKIMFMYETCKLAQEVPNEEMQKILDEHNKSMKCPSE